MNTEYDQGWKDGYKHGAWASEPVAEPRKQTAEEPLSDEQITEAIRTSSLYMKPSPHTPQSIWLALLMGYARAIEAAHGITGETK